MAEVSFGVWLRRRRKALDFTQKQLAQQINCSASALRKIEAEERRPSAQIVEQLAEIFRIPPNEQIAFLQFARGNRRFAVPELIEEAPWRASTGSPRSNLPTLLSSFIGREKEQAEILELTNRRRLVTLVGSGGVGKTRLSLKIGEQVLEDYAQGVWLVELAPVLDPRLFPRITAIAIGLRDEPQRPVIDMLSDYLRQKQMLIILDNCEHLLDACALFCDTLLKNCPHLKILATSRESLGILGEAVYHVPSLELPDPAQLLEKFRDYESVRLFEERAQLAQMDFSLTLENAPSVAKICTRLDGIPLAIELAAARVSTFSTMQIAARLQESFNLLTTGNRAALPRHQTLQAAIDWSYDLLSPAEQTLFQRLSVFVSGWTLEEAESICADVKINSENILDLLTQLINKSLVNIEEVQSDTRYRLLQTIRQYANEKSIESGERDSLRDRHLKYFLNLAEIAEPHLRRKEQLEWLNRLDAEHENLRAALSWGLEKPSAEHMLRLVSSLETYWFLRAHWLEGAKWLDEALKKEWDQNNVVEKAARARALYRRADLADHLDQIEVMKTSAEPALKLCQEVGDRWGTAYSRAFVAQFRGRIGSFKVSRSLFEQSLDEFQRMNDTWGESFISGSLTSLLMMVGRQDEYLEMRQRAITCARLSGDRELIARSLQEYALDFVAKRHWGEAEKILQEAEQLFTAIGSSYGINLTHLSRAQILFGRGDYEQAKAEATRILEYSLRVGDKNLQAQSLNILGLIAEIENDLKNALEYQQRSSDLFQAMEAPQYIGATLVLGRLHYQTRDREAAKRYVRESLRLVRRRSDMMGTWGLHFLFSQMGWFFVERETRLAVQFLALAENSLQEHPLHSRNVLDKPFFERFLSAARAKLSEAEFTSAWETGSKMTVDEALELALKTAEKM